MRLMEGVGLSRNLTIPRAIDDRRTSIRIGPRYLGTAYAGLEVPSRQPLLMMPGVPERRTHYVRHRQMLRRLL
jgi:hypothetical protein